MYIQKKRIYADEELMDEEMIDVDAPVDDMPAEGGEAVVDPEAAELLFEAEDVAELVAEVAGAPVEVTVDDEVVTFTVGEDEFVVEPEGDEEVLEASRSAFRGKRVVKASSRKPAARRPAARRASVKASSRTARPARRTRK